METPIDPSAILSEIERTPLLGEGLARVEILRTQLTRHLASHPDPALVLRQRLHLGRLLLVLDSPDAGAFLAHLARDAAARGAPAVALRAVLLGSRAASVAGDPASGAALLAAAPDVPDDPDARLDRLLAEAWLGGLDEVRLLDRALEKLPPARDHDRLAVLLELADLCEQGGDPTRARFALAEALDLALRHGASAQAGTAALLLGALLLRTGNPGAARGALAQALAEGGRAGDTLVQAAAGSLLVALLLDQGALEPLLHLSAQLLGVARKRHNPALLASLVLDRATAHAALGRPDHAIRELLLVATELERQAEHEPLNVLKARLAELLPQVGPERFGALVLETLRPEPPPAGT